MTTHSGRAGLRAVDDAVDRLIDQLMDQFREARAEHNIAAAKMKAEFNAEIAELRGDCIGRRLFKPRRIWRRLQSNLVTRTSN